MEEFEEELEEEFLDDIDIIPEDDSVAQITELDVSNYLIQALKVDVHGSE